MERRPKEHDGYPVYEFEEREVVDRSPYLRCIYLDNSQPVNEGFIPQNYARAEEEIETGKKKKYSFTHCLRDGKYRYSKNITHTSKDQN
ncbi:hypothetical protein [Wolbachia endosymbiont of Tetranychus urticae]|uniref:hypothetical protein n=1 Tax=Wolbachia endosymbiont of Tetranychus urticae TaxID=169184 RepID=UPI00397D0808